MELSNKQELGKLRLNASRAVKGEYRKFGTEDLSLSIFTLPIKNID